jgi:hypothetical protein
MIYLVRGGDVATFRDPVKCFAPLEVIERLIEIRRLYGFPTSLSIENQEQLATALQAFGFDGYRLGKSQETIDFELYQSAIVPSGDMLSDSLKNH